MKPSRILNRLLLFVILTVIFSDFLYVLHRFPREGRISGHLAEQGRVRPDLENISAILERYQTQNGDLPGMAQGLNALVTMPAGDPQPKGWRQLLPQVPQDPWGQEYHYRNPTTHRAKSGYDVFSSGPDRDSDTADDRGNWQ